MNRSWVRQFAVVAIGASSLAGLWSSLASATSPSFPAVAVATNPGTIVSPVVVKSITVGSTPLGISSDGTNVWVANDLTGTVSSITAATGTVASSVTPGSQPNAVSSDGTHVWVTNANLNEVSEYTTTGTFVQNFTGITSPQGVSSDGTNVWVTSGTNTVDEINIASSSVTATTLPTGSLPLGVSSDGTNVWVADSGTAKVTQINAASGLIVNSISVGTTPTGVSSDGSNVWVTNYGSGTVSEISTSSATVVHTITVGTNPTGISSDATDVWVANYTSGNVSEIQVSTSTVVATLTVGSHPEGVSADGTQVWVANSSSTSVSEIASALSITTTALLNASTTSAYSQTIAASGGVGAYSWSATGLPGALSINATTGVISGSNPAAGNYVVAVTVTDPIGQSATLYSSIYASTFPTIDVPYYPGNIPNPVVAFNSSTFYEGADANAISVDANDAWYANLIGYNSGSTPGGTCGQNNGCGSVTEVNLTTGAIVQTILGGPTSQPSGFPTTSACATASGAPCSAPGVFTYPAAIYSDGTYVWIPSFASGVISQYKISTGLFVGSNITVGTLPSGVYSDGTDAWVTNALGDSVSEIQISSSQSTVINTISVPASPRGITGDGQYVFVAEGSGKVSIINKATHSVVTTTSVGGSGDNIYGVSADGTHVWATDLSTNTLYELDESGIGYTPASTSANATSTWTVSLSASPTGALSSGGSFSVSFPDSVSIPANPTVTLGSGFTGTCSGATATSSGEQVTVTLAGSCALAANTAASLTVAGITNPNVTTTGQAAFSVIQGITNSTYLYHPGSVSADGTDVWVANDANASSGTNNRTPTVTEFSSATGAFVQAYTGLAGTTTGTTQVVGGVASTGQDVWVAVGENSSTANNSQTVEIKPAPSLASTTLSEVNSNTGTPTQVITATGGQGPFTYGATGLPTGLSINTSTGAITGTDTTPNGSTPATVTVTATDARGNATSITQPLYVDPPPTLTTPAIGSTPAGSFPEAGAGSAYSASVIGGAGTGAGTYTYTATNLPPGLSINASTGVISGTPSAGGTYAVTVVLTDAGGATATLTSNIVVVAPPYITTASPVTGATVGTAYSSGTPLVTVQGAGGTGPYTWSATGLPTGLSINSSTGAITGTPTVAGNYTPTITITDAGGLTSTKVLTMNANGSPTASMVSATSGGTTTATFTGSVNPNGLSTAVSFCYATVQANLSVDCPTQAGGSATVGATSLSASVTPVSGSSTLSPTASVTGLTPGTTYYVEEQATNADGTTTTSNLSFTTSVAAPVVTDTAASSVLATSAGLNATVNPGGSSTTIAFCYASTSAALANCPLTASGAAGAGTTVVAASTPSVSGSSNVASTIGISGLAPNSTYYYEAIATNSVASTTGSPVQSFTTSSVTPLVSASAASSVTTTSATLNGTINPGGALTNVAFCYGATLAALANCPSSTSGTPGTGATLLAVPTVTGTSLVNDSASATGLLPGVTYYYEEIGSNSGANATSTPVQSFTTTVAVPTATTVSASPLTTTATVQGSVNPGGAATNVSFCYGLTLAALANCPSTATGTPSTGASVTSATTPSVSGNSATSTSGALTGLLPGTTYYVEEIATNSAGTADGTPAISFTTQVALPMSTTLAPTVVGPTGATLNGSVNPGGGSTAVSFCFIQATTLNNCAGASTVPISSSPILGTSSTPLNATLSGLNPNTSYCYQEVSTNSAGTTYGTPVCFLTIGAGPTLTTTSLPSGVPSAPYTTTLTTSGGTAPITFTASGLPPGLSINSMTGVISGTPTTDGNYPVILTATDANNQISQKTLNLTISASPSIATTSLPDAPSSGPYTTTVEGGGGVAPDTWSQTGLPAGLTLNPISGIISGVATVGPGAYPVAITLTDANGLKTTTTFTLVIAAPPSITTVSLSSSTEGKPYSSTVTGSGSGPFTWQATGLPGGLAINALSGLISGTAPVAGKYPITVTLTDAAGQVAMKTYYITIDLKPLILPPSMRSVINFGENSITLTKLAQKKISNVALFMKKHAGYANVVLTGYADPLSNRAYNLALGKRRSAVVKAQLARDLKSLRVKGIVIAISSKGESNPASPGLSAAARAADRRVTVVVD